MNRFKRFGALILALVLMIPFAGMAEEDYEESYDESTEESIGEETDAGETVTEKDGWHFDSKGFLTGDHNPGDEYLLEDEENGVWQYASKDLSVKIIRVREKYNKQKMRPRNLQCRRFFPRKKESFRKE